MARHEESIARHDHEMVVLRAFLERLVKAHTDLTQVVTTLADSHA